MPVYIRESFKISRNSFYQSVVEQTAVGYSYNRVIYDENGLPIDYEFVEMNKAYESMLGILERDWIGKRISVLYEQINKEPLNWSDYHQTIFAKQMKKETDMKFKHANKFYRVKIHFPNKDHIIISLTDVTIEIEDTQKIQTLFDSVPIQVWYLKDAETYLSANKVHADFIGVASEDLADKDLNELLASTNADVCIKSNQAVFKEKRRLISQEWVNNSQGEKRLLKITRDPKLNEQGDVDFVICAAEDITEEHKNTQEKEIQERILYSTIDFTQELLTNKNLKEALASGIRMLGDATKVDRVYYWENHYDTESKQWLTSSKIDWHLDGTQSLISDTKHQAVPFEQLADFMGSLSQRQTVRFHTKNLSEMSSTKLFLEGEKTLSALAIPIFLKNKFIGFVGFDSYNHEREWTEVEVSLLKSFVLLYEEALERKLLEDEITQKNDNLFNFFNMIEDLFIVLDNDGTIIDVNNNVLERLNYEKSELLGASYLKLHPVEEIAKIEEDFDELLTEGTEYFKLNVVTKDGIKFPIEVRNSRGVWNGKPVIFAVGKDVSELVLSEDKFSKAFNNSGVSMFISRFEDGEILEVNDKFIDFFGYEKSEVIGKTTLDIKMTKEYETRDLFKELIQTDQKIVDFEIEYIDKHKQIRTGLTNIVPVRINGEECLLTSIIDISERIKNEKEIIELSTRDYLTNVYNRRFIYEVLEEIIQDSKREKAVFSLAIIDIDNFKSINDQYGHQVGDDVLIEFSKVIRESLRSNDILGRYGGEEFIIIVNHADIDKSYTVLERILENIRDTIFTQNEEQIELTFSAGLSSSQELSQEDLTIDGLVELADKRMYRAKNKGKNQIIYKE